MLTISLVGLTFDGPLSNASAVFQAGYRISGDHGCYNFFGSWVVAMNTPRVPAFYAVNTRSNGCVFQAGQCGCVFCCVH